MVRVLSCHHFRGQHIGRCEEAIGVAVAGTVIIVALDHQVNIYAPADVVDNPSSWFPDSPPELLQSDDSTIITGILGCSHPKPVINNSDLGTSFVYHRRTSSGSYLGNKRGVSSSNGRGRFGPMSGTRSADTPGTDTQLKLSHTFPTVDLLESMSYNKKGHYLLCLEKRELSSAPKMTSVRIYFHWDRRTGTKPMRARIAGLVSPTGAEPEDDALMMVEIPLTSPATAAASCNLSGHIACLSAESIVNIFLFRMKEATGRVKVQYADFDRMYALEMPGFAPESISFLSDYIACMNSHQVLVFRMTKEERPGSVHMVRKPGAFAASDNIISVNNIRTPRHSKPSAGDSKVVFDPKNETVKVHLNTITRANRKKKSPKVGITEEYREDIVTNRTKVNFTAVLPGIFVEDFLRISTTAQHNSSTTVSPVKDFVQVGLYPIRTQDTLGGVTCLVGMSKEAFLYHLPGRRDGFGVRVISYPFTAPLVSFAFDSLFFHALTETGLETYTCRSLYYTLRDTEGLKKFQNDCPFQDEGPCLVGIRPFLGVRFMAANEYCMCLLACPTSPTNNINPSPSSPVTPPPNTNEENSWTVYSLDLPDMDLIYEDTMKAAQLHKESKPESFITLICELHLLLRLYMNAHPDTETVYLTRYRETCKIIGLEYFKSAAAHIVTPTQQESSSALGPLSGHSAQCNPEDMLDKGVTYLQMAHFDLQLIFAPENVRLTKDPKLIPGFVRLVEVVLPTYQMNDSEATLISPTLAPILVEFLATHAPHVLVDMVIMVPFLRECNSTRLVQMLRQLAVRGKYGKKETLALLLTMVTVGGGEPTGRTEVKEVLDMTNSSDLASILQLHFVIDHREKKKVCLTDLSVCLVAAASTLPAVVVSRALIANEITVAEVMLAFAQAVNLNSDLQVQQCLTRTLSSILENFFSWKLKVINSSPETIKLTVGQTMAAGVTTGPPPGLTEDEKRAVQALVRSYLSHISLGIAQKNTTVHLNSRQQQNSNLFPVQNGISTVSSIPANDSVSSETSDTPSVEVVNVSKAPSAAVLHVQEVIKISQLFGKIPNFINYVLTNEYDGGLGAGFTHGQNLITFSRFPTEECRENFIKLTGLLASSFGCVEGVKEQVIAFLQKNGVPGSPLHTVLYLLVESVDNAIGTLTIEQPTTILLYAKEMFARSTSKWKILVSKLKEKINADPDDKESEIFATIIESVYLHLANTLSPSELEEVLDKEEQNAKFHTTCKRVELASSYANMVIAVSNDYLHKQ